MEMWNEWCKESYSLEDVQASLDLAKIVGEMGWPTIQDVFDRMKMHHVDSIDRFKLSESERECIEKAMYSIHHV